MKKTLQPSNNKYEFYHEYNFFILFSEAKMKKLERLREKKIKDLENKREKSKSRISSAKSNNNENCSYNLNSNRSKVRNKSSEKIKLEKVDQINNKKSQISNINSINKSNISNSSNNNISNISNPSNDISTISRVPIKIQREEALIANKKIKANVNFTKLTNKKFIKSAISNVCLAGEPNRVCREKILEIIEKCPCENFIILFKANLGRFVII